MSFTHFCEAITLMAYLAHREFNGSVVTPANKINALLLYMWKAINNSEKSNRRIAENRSNVLTSYAGSLNLFGSSLFSDLVLNNWTKDRFRDYTLPQEMLDSRNNTTVLQLVVGEHNDGPNSSGSSSGTQTPTSTYSAPLSLPGTPHSVASRKSLATTGDGGRTRATSGLGVAESNPSNPSSSWDWLNLSMGVAMADNGTASTVSSFNQSVAPPLRPAKSAAVTLRGADIAILLARRPELGEFLFLEIQTMKAVD
jgi:hypothetical protein